jgi:hypothetical protein
MPMVCGWAYAYACAMADEGKDIRVTEAPAMLEQCQRDIPEHVYL